jgi:hypothetical protein
MQNSKTNHQHRKHPPTARPVNKPHVAGPENHQPTPPATVARQAYPEPEGRTAAPAAIAAAPADFPPQGQSSAATEIPRAVSPPEKQPPAGDGTVAALDRLGEKLDRTAALLERQLEAWKQTPAIGDRRPAPEEAPARTAIHAPEAGREVSTDGTRVGPPVAPRPATTETQNENIPAAPPGPPAETANLAGDTRRLLDRLSRSQNGWRDPLTDLRQAVDAIMEYLENQAAASPPPVDVSDILSRLKNLEVEQKNLQTRLNIAG